MKKNALGIIAVVLLLIPSLTYLVENILNSVLLTNLDISAQADYWSVIRVINIVMNIITIAGYIFLGIHFIKTK